MLNVAVSTRRLHTYEKRQHSLKRLPAARKTSPQHSTNQQLTNGVYNAKSPFFGRYGHKTLPIARIVDLSLFLFGFCIIDIFDCLCHVLIWCSNIFMVYKYCYRYLSSNDITSLPEGVFANQRKLWEL